MSSRVMIGTQKRPEAHLPGQWYRWECPDCGDVGDWKPDRATAMSDRLLSPCYKRCKWFG